MAKLTDSINTFQTGDLVFTRYPPKGQQPIHVTMFLGGDAGGPNYVHAGATQLEIAGIDTYAEDKDSGGYLHAHPVDANRRSRTAQVARAFAQTIKPTPYGSFPTSKELTKMGADPKSSRASRFAGMIGTPNVGAIPFELPALHRLLKWTERAIAGAPLSENRGITCAAFAACCHQVGMMKAFLTNPDMIVKPVPLAACVRSLDGMVVTKDSLRQGLELLVPAEKSTTGKPIFKGQALPKHSNRVLTGAGQQKLSGLAQLTYDTLYGNPLRDRMPARANNSLPLVEKLWLIVQVNYLEIPSYGVSLLEDILGTEFMFDAKYVSSPVLAGVLRGGTGNGVAGWNTTEYTHY